MKTIVYAHPYAKSFNHAILERMTAYFTETNQDYQVIDLYKDDFEPRFSAAELALFSKGDTPYQLVHHYQDMIAASDELLFIFPIWWHVMPSELKGFFDKVMLKNFAAVEEPEWKGLLTYIKKATVITTATDTKKRMISVGGNPIQGTLINVTFNDLGIDPKHTNWIHMGEVNLTTDAVRKQFLADLPVMYQHGQK